MKTIDNIYTIIVELLWDSGSNCFIVNNNKLLNGLNPYRETIWVTRRTNEIVTCIGTLCLLLQNNTRHLVIQVKNVPYIESNPHNDFPILPFYDYGFK